MLSIPVAWTTLYGQFVTTLLEPDLTKLAQAWIAVDPDPHTRAEIEAMLSDPSGPLADVFGSMLSFGTAGLRGRLGPGPSQMNRVLIRVVAAALAARVGNEKDPHVIVGFDARYKSRDFAEDTARVLAAGHVRCTLLPRPLPTPVVAFAVKQLDAAAGVMVTASHNPRADNGYKVYWRGGAQITSPVDTEISDLIDQIPLLAEAHLASLDDDLIEVAGDDLVTAYVETIAGLLEADSPRTARVAYTPLHGVGYQTLQDAFAAAGFPEPDVVASQAEPDPDFPTTPFPNPEETGVVDPLLQLASDVSADVALANDPDADRLAVAVPNGTEWRLLTGDEVGSILAEHLLRRSAGDGADAQRLLINTVVSSQLLAAIADHHGATYVETLTGFKWIMRAQHDRPDMSFVLGYEEALGYSVGSEVRDKDGVSAALIVAELVSMLAAEGKTVLDLLDEIHMRHGVHVTGQRSIRFEATSAATPIMEAAMAALRDRIPAELGGMQVTATTDLSKGSELLPATDAVILQLEHGRLIVRPSGTEPKMKVYGEIVGAPSPPDVSTARTEARVLLTAMLDDAVRHIAAPEFAPLPAATDEDVDALAARADTLFAGVPHGAARAADLRLAVRCIDLTTLEGDDTPGRVRALCAQARRPDPADPTVGPTAAVCVYPSLVSLAAGLNGGSPVRVASVAGAFPSGLSDLAVRLADISAALGDGADEIDIVLNRSAFLAGRLDQVADELRQSRAAAGEAVLKVILEVGELGSPAAIRAATELAIDAGAQFVKTSTGKSKVSATPLAVVAMADTVADHVSGGGQPVGIKISGGVRSADDALGYLAIVRSVLGDDWLTPDRFRFGASSLLTSLLADLTTTEAAFRG